MGLSSRAFWALTVREFWIKHRAFTRAEDRKRALVRELAMLTTNFKPNAFRAIERERNALRRYPIKPWLHDLK